VDPASELYVGARYGVEALDDGGVERTNEGWMNDVQQIGDCRPEAFDGVRVQRPNARQDFLRLATTLARVEEFGERPLICGSVRRYPG
jgi:hypothetical protein